MKLNQLKAEAEKMGYELRKKGHHRDKKNSFDAEGNPVLDCYHPHLKMTASDYARTKKVYAAFHEQFKKIGFGELDSDSGIYRAYLLLFLEHAAREIKISGKGVSLVCKMMLPLPKSEHVKNLKKGNN